MKKIWIVIGLLVIGWGLLQRSLPLSQGALPGEKTTAKKVLILGFDGLDPQILSRLLKAEQLPNFKALIDKGGFRPLTTSVPPLSPVAWSNFITGMNPGGHGIFDFIHRDPRTLSPYLSTSRTETATRSLTLGKWIIPLSSGSVHLLRQGKAFWQILEENNIPTTIVRVPANFPPVESGQHQLSGMGTPDLLGTYGLFSFFTDEPDTYKVKTGGAVFPVQVKNHHVQAKLMGPGNSFRTDASDTAVEFNVYIDPVNPVAKIVMQDHELILEQGEWSPWLSIQFEMIPYLQGVQGMVRFYLKEVHPHFKLYATPVNIDPSAPALPLSTPEAYVHDMCDDIGPFYTQGMPHDTNALSEGVLDDGEFLQQAGLVFGEHKRMFDRELSRFKEGLLFLYTDRVDQVGHMFWRTMDPKHPAHTPNSPYAGIIDETYRNMDTLVGKAVQAVDDQTTLIIMSDHGFAPFYRAFNLNTWLQKEGYVQLKEQGGQENAEFLLSVNWRKTQAYGVGFNGVYLNLSGREPEGIVSLGAERDALLKEISKKLLAVKDPKTGEPAIAKVYRAEEIYSGSYLSQAPDLVVGYNRGYRVSWESVLGKFPDGLFRDNVNKWSGDHSTAAELVPGVLVSNKQLGASQPALYDLAPTILNEFSIAKAPDMVGKSLF